MNAPPRLGPIAYSVTLVPDLKRCVSAYCENLHQQVAHACELSTESATALGVPELAGSRAQLLANKLGRRWLWMIETPELPPRNALRTHGWLAQEVLVADVDALVAALDAAFFTILRPPADLDVSDRIRASQVQGPAGEILYLTQVRPPVPPFELPFCKAPVDHLFIPVLSTPDRERSLAEYAGIAEGEGLCFDTRISVVNQELGLPLEERHPVATLQLAGNALIEIDSISLATPPVQDLCLGTASIVFESSAAAPAHAICAQTGPFAGRCVSHHRGNAGERYALLHSKK